MQSLITSYVHHHYFYGFSSCRPHVILLSTTFLSRFTYGIGIS